MSTKRVYPFDVSGPVAKKSKLSVSHDSLEELDWSQEDDDPFSPQTFTSCT